jgi:hypothetical protein
MGHAPPKERKRPTRLHRAVRQYVQGQWEVEEFERVVGELMRLGVENEIVPMVPPRQSGYEGLGTRGELR